MTSPVGASPGGEAARAASAAQVVTHEALGEEGRRFLDDLAEAPPDRRVRALTFLLMTQPGELESLSLSAMELLVMWEQTNRGAEDDLAREAAGRSPVLQQLAAMPPPNRFAVLSAIVGAGASRLGELESHRDAVFFALKAAESESAPPVPADAAAEKADESPRPAAVPQPLSPLGGAFVEPSSGVCARKR